VSEMTRTGGKPVTSVRRAICALTVLVAMWGVPATALAAADAYEPDNSAGSAKSTALYLDVVSTGARAHTFTSASDQDWIKFKATGRKEYSVKVYASSTKNPDTWVRVQPFRKSGTRLVPVKSESYLGDDVTETYDFVAPASTTIYVRLRPFRKTAGVAGKRYLARVSTGFPKPTQPDPFEDADDFRAGAHPIAVGTGFNAARYDTDDTYRYELTMKRSELHNIYNPVGNVDEDWYTFTTASDEPYSILLFNGLYANRAVELELYDETDTLIGQTASGSAVYKRWTWSNLGTATYRLRVYSTDAGNGAVPYWYRLGIFTP